MALVELSLVEQRYRAVLAVLSGVTVVDAAEDAGVSRQSVHAWVARYQRQGLAGLMDRPRRPKWCPRQTDEETEALVCELRRGHPRWGPRRLAHELSRQGAGVVLARSTIYRILVRHGLIEPKSARRRRQDYRRFERDAPMSLWQLDIVGGVMITTDKGDPTEAKVVTGLDDHSRYCVIASVVPRATGRAVCLAFAGALRRFGIPDEVLSDNGKQFTARFGRGGEVLFDRICRDNGIAHRLTQPASPTTTGKVERFHQSLRRELLDDAGVFACVSDAQATVDSWIEEYNTRRPHQALDMATPASRFRPASVDELLPLRLPAVLEAVVESPESTARPVNELGASTAPRLAWNGGPIEFERVVPASGNLAVAGKQFWLGPSRAGLIVTFWADPDVIHLLISGTRLKSLRSHLSVADLASLVGKGARPAGPSPLPPVDAGEAVEVDRLVNASGLVGLGGRQLLAAEILAGRQVGIRVEPSALMFFDLDTRQLLRTRPNPLSPHQLRRLRGVRPAGPPPRPSPEPVTVQRRVSPTGAIVVAGQKVALGRPQAGQVVTVHVADTTLTVEFDGEIRTVRRTTTKPVIQIKGQRPRKVPYVI